MAFSIQKPNNNIESEDIQQFKDRRVSIKELLIYCTETNCSDLYIKVGEKPYISRFGTLIELPCAELSNNDWFEFFDLYVKEEFNAQYVREKMYDTAIEILIPEDSSLYNKYPSPYFRYRASFGYSTGKNICTFRMIRPEAPSFNSINYPPDCLEALKKSFQHKTGITMWTGATGSGKGIEVSTNIPTIFGMKTIKDIKIGDIIFDKNGDPTKVIDKYCPNDPISYEVSLSDGSNIKVTAGHLWEVELLNQWTRHGNSEYYNKYLNDKSFIDALKQCDIGNVKLTDFIKYVVAKSNFTMLSFRNFLRTYFKDVISSSPQEAYIDLKVILNKSTHTNAQSRVDRINWFIKENKKTIVTNSEAKSVLGSKFIHIIRKCGIQYQSHKEVTIDANMLSIMILDWTESFKNSLIKKQEIKTLTTQEMVDIGIKNRNNRTNFAIRRPQACQYNQIELPIKPYFLGAWLGDGSSCASKIFGQDIEIFNRCKEDYEISKIYTHPAEKYPNGFYTYSFKGVLLKETNLLKNKHIPDIYRVASPEDKLELLAGLIDTDGHVDKNGVIELQLINKQIICATREIACSLGIKCSIITEKTGTYNDENGNTVECQTGYRLMLTPLIMIPLQVPKKRIRLQEKIDKVNSGETSQSARHERFYITNIKEIKGDPNDYYCLAVDSPTHVFLCTESYIPTHNTTTLVACINDFSQKGGLLDNKVFITLEDPIEYEFKSTPSFKVVQKELGKDFKNYKNGIIQALREHPTHLLVGEARDKEVITAVIEACRTGHYCTTSFHASTVSGTISRILYYLDNDINLAYDLIINLNGIFSQRLLKREDRYEVDVQYMLFNDKITKTILDAIDEGKNIQVTVEKLFQDEELLKSGDVKDWTYKGEV